MGEHYATAIYYRSVHIAMLQPGTHVLDAPELPPQAP